MDFIEAELAKRSQRDAPSDAPGTGTDGLASGARAPVEQSASAFAQREPASLGKLHEIDLGHEAKLQNIARTEAATQKLSGNQGEAVDGDAALNKSGLGKDGQSWRSRKRRTSQDIERDRLVEEVLRESKRESFTDLSITLVADYGAEAD